MAHAGSVPVPWRGGDARRRKETGAVDGWMDGRAVVVMKDDSEERGRRGKGQTEGEMDRERGRERRELGH